MYIILSGNAVDGLTPWGPFESGEAATDWAEGNLCGVDWHVTELESPVKGIEAEREAEEARVKVGDAIMCISRYVECDNASSDALDVLVQAIRKARAGLAG